ncbi:HAD hydrolase-like protein, partial [bacterium]|nr:HAD hydrolase-like protein [bacterium]
AEAEALGWTRRFGRLVGANDAARDKPDPAPVWMALESSGLQPQDGVWFIGDSDIDMQCAHAAGMVGVLIPHPDDDGVENGAAASAFPPAL